MPTRRTYLAATLNGVNIPNILSARCSFGFDMRVSEAVVYVPVSPGFQLYDQNLVLSLGAGTSNVQRFSGFFRRYDYTLYPRMLGLVCYGPLVRALDYENNDFGSLIDGLDVPELVGSGGGTDQAFVMAVLNRVPRLMYSAGNIRGTGVTLGANTAELRAAPFLWRSGTNTSVLTYGGKGESALDYIHRIDEISAVATPPPVTTPAGFYRTYDGVSGVISRSLLGSRPRGVVDFTFTEGVDIWQGTSSREYPIANRVFVQGYDFGGAFGKAVGPESNISSAYLQSSNPFMPASEKYTYAFSSGMIERSLDTDPGPGMSAETVANALMLDVNRETVRATFTTPRDDLIGPGATVLVQGPGGQPDRLGIGENLWVTHIDIGVDENGAFSQVLQCLGGGLPDQYTPAPLQ